MRIKLPNAWKIPAMLRLKRAGVWTPANQVFAKNSGTWKKTADYNPVFRFVANCTTAGLNAYAYETVWKGSMLIETGDTFEFEVYSDTNSAMVGIDFFFPAEKMRHFDIRDQNNQPIHPASNIQTLTQRWHKRVFSLNPVAGMTASSGAICIENDEVRLHRVYFRNARIRRANGTVKWDLTGNGYNFGSHEAWVGAGYNGYTFISKGVTDPLNLD